MMDWNLKPVPRGGHFLMHGDDEVLAYFPEEGVPTDPQRVELLRILNAHDALVAALEAYVAAEVPEMQSEHFQERLKAAGPRGATVVAAYHEARAALALARGEARGAGMSTQAELIASVFWAKRKADVVLLYRENLNNPEIDWPLVNRTIIERWSLSALRDIKHAAWKGTP